MKIINITDNNVRFLGRSMELEGARWMAFSATGIEFTFTGCSLYVDLKADERMEDESKAPHMVVFADGIRIDDFVMKKRVEKHCIFDGTSQKVSVVVRILKVSEATESTVGIQALVADDRARITPTLPNRHRIEFIGDSITCGYGINAPLGEMFSTANEDASKAYAYGTAQELSADCSLIAMSGHGIISGYTETDINKEQLVMPYYKTMGKSYGSFDGRINPGEVAWDFTKWQPELVVINLGTNDTSWCKEITERVDAYQEEYIETLRVVRACNPEAEILCILGIMQQTLFGAIEQAVAKYKQLTGDGKVATLEFPLQLEEDGYVVDWHPSMITHEKAKKRLTDFIRTQYQW